MGVMNGKQKIEMQTKEELLKRTPYIAFNHHWRS